MENTTKLQISIEELNKISSIAKERKFMIKENAILYHSKEEEKIDFFIKSYKFLNNLEHNIQDSYPEIANKIKIFLKQFYDLYAKSIEYKAELEDGISYGHYDLIKKIRNFLILNFEQIELLLNTVYPIGKQIVLYDPDSAAGFV